MTNTTREERDEALRCTSLCATRRYCEDVEFYRKVLRDAERLAAIEPELRNLLESLGKYPEVLNDPLDVENLRDRLRAILDSEQP